MNKKIAFAAMLAGVVLLLVEQYGGSFGRVLPSPFVKPQIGWVVIVEEATERKPIVAAIVTSSWLKDASDKGFQAVVTDQDTPTGKQYADVIEGRELPVAVVITTDNKLLGVVDLPNKLAELDAAIQEVGRYAD